MRLVERSDTPGSVRDAPEGSGLYDNWHRRVARLLKVRTQGSGSGEFFDPLVNPTGGGSFFAPSVSAISDVPGG